MFVLLRLALPALSPISVDWLGIVAATLLAGIGSVCVAAGLLHIPWIKRWKSHMLSLAAGSLLATAFLHVLPEAARMPGVDHDRLFAVLLAGIVVFFILDKAQLWHHGHEHGHEDSHHHHHHHHGHTHGPASLPTGPWSLMVGDGVHAFGDGILIASSFLASPQLGWLAAAAVGIHEIPHHVGDLLVLRASPSTHRQALIKLVLVGSFTLLGGLVGCGLLAHYDGALPFFLAMACASFIYVALADLIPQLQKQHSPRHAVGQLLGLGIGMAWVTVFHQSLHA
jgi:zinc and cadmium transporter